MLKNLLLALILSGVVGPLAAQQDTLTFMSYNLLNFPTGRNDCGDNVVVPARWDTLRIIADYVRPDVLMVCELQNEAGADSILNRALNVGGKTSFRRANFVLNRSAVLNRDLNNMFFYDSQKLQLISQAELLADTRDVGYYRTWLKEQEPIGPNDTIFIDFYVVHFKASASDSTSRAATCQIIRDHIDAQPANRRAVLGGDFNFYTADESGYQILMNGAKPLRDPINQSGSWTNNSAFAPYHSQSTRSSSTPFYDCGASGGVDDRFDFILLSDSSLSGARLSYIPNSYTVLANNGTTFNTAINSSVNTSPVPRLVQNALFHMSDHLPIVLKMQAPRAELNLSINLQSFEGLAKETGHFISWTMSPDTNNRLTYFELEQSDDAMTFNVLCNINAVAGQQDYSYFRPNIDAIKYYRLRWYERNGDQNRSQIIAVLPDTDPAAWLLYPNPVGDALQIKAPTFLQDADATFTFYDFAGREAMRTQSHFEGRFAALPLQNLPAGLYVVLISYHTGSHRQILYKKD